MERSQVHPNTMKRNKTRVLGPMGWIGCIHREKFRCDFVARTFAIIAPHSAHFAPSLMQQQNSPKCTQTLRNTRKHEFRIQWVDLARLLRKIPMWLRGKNFCINCTSLARFAPSFVQQRNYPKWTQTLRNAARHEFRVQWSGSGAFVAKNSKTTSWHELLN